MSQNNIMTYEQASIRFQMDYSEYYDLYLSEKPSFGYCFTNGLDEACLIAYIDFTDPKSYNGLSVYANSAYTYESAVTTPDYKLYNIGSVGMDNGLVRFNKETISNAEFIDLFTNTEITVPNNPNLFLTETTSNTGSKSGSTGVSYQGVSGASFNGNYYQGFFQTLCDRYKTLPTELEDCWHWEFVLNGTGTFFYIGTRAENKWWRYYKHYEDEVSQLDTRSCEDENKDTEHYITPEDSYFADDYLFESNQEDLLSYFADDYMNDEDEIKDLDINNIELKDENGNPIGENIIDNSAMAHFDTDNKFLIMHRGKDAVTVCNYNSADTYTFYYARKPYRENLFLKLQRGKNCYTVKDLIKDKDALDTDNTSEYAVFRDLYNNAFSLSVTEEGAIEYKYLTVDCDKINESESAETQVSHAYKIMTEKTKDGLIESSKFSVVNVKVKKLGGESMRLYIYVNGYLVLVGQELPIFQFKQLDDMYEKQEAVPFNISLGGGTQGLGDVIYPDFFTKPCQEFILPLEKEFGQTPFNGNIKSFKFYNCDKEYMDIKGNYLYEKRTF